MTTTSKQSVSIRADAQKTELSKQQKTFNRLINQIEKKRAQLQEWEQVLPQVRQKVASDLLPLFAQIKEVQRQMVFHLDRLSEQKGWRRKERGELADFICDLADDLLQHEEDAELQALLDKHRTAEMDQQDEAAMSGMRDMLEQMFGVDLGDTDDLKTPEDLMQRAQEKLQAERGENPSEKPRKKTPKQQAKEDKQKAEAQQLNQSIREVYRKLASALHPDREPDEQERARKTALMQAVNEAYQSNNLLRLLELQLELEHIDQATINNISEDRLKHYNKVLKEQVAELDHELASIELGLQQQFRSAPFRLVAPKTAVSLVTTEVRKLKAQIKQMKADMAHCRDVKTTRELLKIMAAENAVDFDLFPFS